MMAYYGNLPSFKPVVDPQSFNGSNMSPEDRATMNMRMNAAVPDAAPVQRQMPIARPTVGPNASQPTPTRAPAITSSFPVNITDRPPALGVEPPPSVYGSPHPIMNPQADVPLPPSRPTYFGGGYSEFESNYPTFSKFVGAAREAASAIPGASYLTPAGPLGSQQQQENYASARDRFQKENPIASAAGKSVGYGVDLAALGTGLGALRALAGAGEAGFVMPTVGALAGGVKNAAVLTPSVIGGAVKAANYAPLALPLAAPFASYLSDGKAGPANDRPSANKAEQSFNEEVYAPKPLAAEAATAVKPAVSPPSATRPAQQTQAQSGAKTAAAPTQQQRLSELYPSYFKSPPKFSEALAGGSNPYKMPLTPAEQAYNDQIQRGMVLENRKRDLANGLVYRYSQLGDKRAGEALHLINGGPGEPLHGLNREELNPMYRYNVNGEKIGPDDKADMLDQRQNAISQALFDPDPNLTPDMKVQNARKKALEYQNGLLSQGRKSPYDDINEMIAAMTGTVWNGKYFVQQ